MPAACAGWKSPSHERVFSPNRRGLRHDRIDQEVLSVVVKIKNICAPIKAGPEDGLKDGEFIVYPSTFTREPDAYGDVVAKGAFLDFIEEWKSSGNIFPGLYGHRMDDPDYFVAGASEMDEDDHGWRVRGMFDMDSPKGPQVYRLVKGRRLNQLSFAYDTLDEGEVELEDGRKANELRKLKAYEFSFVPVGANQDTSVVAVKAIADAIASGGVMLDGAKAGRVLSAKNEEAIRAAVDSLQGVLKSLDSSQDSEDEEKSSVAQSKASGTPELKPEERDSAKGQEQKVNPSVRALAAELALLSVG